MSLMRSMIGMASGSPPRLARAPKWAARKLRPALNPSAMADGGGKKKRPGLKLAVADGDGTTSGLERKDSFTVGEKSFEAGDVRVDSTGACPRSPRPQTLALNASLSRSLFLPASATSTVRFARSPDGSGARGDGRRRRRRTSDRASLVARDPSRPGSRRAWLVFVRVSPQDCT